MVTKYKKELFLDNEILEGMGMGGGGEIHQSIVRLKKYEGTSINKMGSCS